MEAGLSDHVWDVAELVERAMAEPEAPPAPLAPIPSGPQPSDQLGLFPGLPGVLPKLLPPSTGGTASANDNDGAPGAPGPLEPSETEASPSGALEPAEEEEEEEAPATVRDPAPWGAAAPSDEWSLLKEGAVRVV